MRTVSQLQMPVTGAPRGEGKIVGRAIADGGVASNALRPEGLVPGGLVAGLASGVVRESGLGEKLLQVGELAAAAGKTVRAIHLYEELGLLRPDARSKGRFRLYDPQAVTRVRWIGKLHDLGMSLSRIQEVVAEWEGAPSAGRAMSKVRSIYVSKLEETRAQIARLRDLERELTESIDYLDTCETCDSSLSDEAPIPDFSVAVVRRLPQIAETSHMHSHPTSTTGDAESAPEVGSCASCAMRERENEPELVAGIHHYPIVHHSIDHHSIEQAGADVAARGNVPRARPSSASTVGEQVGVKPAGGKPSAARGKPSSGKPSSLKVSAGKPSRSVGE